MTTQHPTVEPAPVAPVPAPAPAKTGNGLGIAALVLGIIGSVLAVIPLVGGFGGFLGLVGLVLGIIALFLKGRKKGIAIAGTVLSGIALILSIVMGLVYTAMFVSSVDQAINQPVTVDPVEGAAEEEPAADGAVGTRENPASIGAVISGAEYDVVINSVTLNATDEVLGANQFNEAPAEGFAYVVVNASITYTGEESGLAAFASIDYVSDSGEVYGQSDTLAVAPEPTLGLDELFTGGTATGNIVIAIPADAQGALRVQPGMFDDEVFVALQ